MSMSELCCFEFMGESTNSDVGKEKRRWRSQVAFCAFTVGDFSNQIRFLQSGMCVFDFDQILRVMVQIGSCARKGNRGEG